MIKYKELKIWDIGIRILKEVYFLSDHFPESEKFGLTSQIKKASISLVSNIAEGAGRNSNQQFVQFLSISKGSAYEIEAQLIIANELGFITNEALDSIIILIQEYCKMNQNLQNYFKNLENK